MLSGGLGPRGAGRRTAAVVAGSDWDEQDGGRGGEGGQHDERQDDRAAIAGLPLVCGPGSAPAAGLAASSELWLMPGTAAAITTVACATRWLCCCATPRASRRRHRRSCLPIGLGERDRAEPGCSGRSALLTPL